MTTYGEVAEWLMATVLKTVEVNSFREFESRPLRHTETPSIYVRCFCMTEPNRRFGKTAKQDAGRDL
jgi:hypothetical protein